MLYLTPIFVFLISGCAASSLQQKQDDLNKDLQELRRSHALTTQRIRELDRLNQTTFLIQDGIEQLSLEIERLGRSLSEMQTQMKIVQAALFDVDPNKTYAAGAVEPQSITAHRQSDASSEAILASSSNAKAAKSARATSVDAPTPQIASGQDDRGIYQVAYEAMQAGRTDDAVAGFSALIERFASSDLADNAHYWLGEIYLSLGDQGSAARHFQQIIDTYPSGNKVPDALYKLGVLAHDQGNCASATSWYRKVQEQFPWAAVSEKVTIKLNECNAKP